MISVVSEFVSEEPQFSRLEVNSSDLDWRVSGRARFLVNGFGRDEGTVPIQNSLGGEETEVRIGGVPFSLEVAFDNAASKADALQQAAAQIAGIARALLEQATSILATHQANTDRSEA